MIEIQDERVKLANSLLNQASTRPNGLELLLRIIPQCSRDILSEYSILWLSKSTEVLKNTKNWSSVTLACKVLVEMMTRCKDISEIQKQISMQYVKQWIAAVSSCEVEKRINGMFYLLSKLLHEYKESSEKSQAAITEIALSHVDSDKKNIVQGGANIYTLLSRATERSFKPPPSKLTHTRYIYNQLLICNSLHAIMNEFFSELIELNTIDVTENLELPDLEENLVSDYYEKLTRRFTNLCVYLSTMLGGCGGKNSTCSTDILRLICRGLAVTPFNLPRQESAKTKIVTLILPELHVNLLMVLNALIDGFGADLLSQAAAILKLYSQTLKWTDKANSDTKGGQVSFPNVRTAVYKSLSTWLTRLKTLSYVESISDDIILQYIIKDITPTKERIQLTIQKPPKMSKKAQKRHNESQYVNSTVLGTATGPNAPCFNYELSLGALEVLENIFKNSAPMLKPNLYKETEKLIVPLLFEVYQGADTDNFYKQNVECRHGLLKLLHVIQRNHHPNLSPPTQYALAICNYALRDANAKIANEAMEFSSYLDTVVHPRAASLQLSDQTPQKSPMPTRLTSQDVSEPPSYGQILSSPSNIENATPETPPPNKMRKLGGTLEVSDIDNTNPRKLQIIEDVIIRHPSEKKKEHIDDKPGLSESEKQPEVDKAPNLGMDDDSGDEAILSLFVDDLREDED